MDLDYNEVPEWRYEMRREMQEILPNLYLGRIQWPSLYPPSHKTKSHISCAFVV
ncbi:hypothetical protein K7432_010835 [Basidiobolus ranarum]|uniref:Uncharacterized protein n=1 Tax=Basidiobolus ranarum TaxID=34480 RepID=A0ABR2VUT3_9FUNG